MYVCMYVCMYVSVCKLSISVRSNQINVKENNNNNNNNKHDTFISYNPICMYVCVFVCM